MMRGVAEGKVIGDDAEDGVEGVKGEDDAHAESAEENDAIRAVEDEE